MSARHLLRGFSVLAALGMSLAVLPGTAGASLVGPPKATGASYTTALSDPIGPAAVAAPCFLDQSRSAISADGLECRATAQERATLSVNCNGYYYFQYSQPQHAQSSISGSASYPGANYIILQCLARAQNANNAWYTVHGLYTAAPNSSIVNGSSFAFLPPPPVDTPQNLCYFVTWRVSTTWYSQTNC